jgi:hypothetical protein
VKERDIVRFWLAEKRRIGVVIEVQGDWARVAYGTTQDDGPLCETVHEDSRHGRAFSLREPTRFYGANTLWEPASNLERETKPCPLDLLYAIRKRVDTYDASLPELPVQDAEGVVHLAKLRAPSRPVTRYGRELPMPWQLVDRDATCVACTSDALPMSRE